MEDRMEPDVAKSELIHDELELRLTVRTNQRAWEVRSDRQVEEAIDGTGPRSDIHDNVAYWLPLRSSGDG